MSKSSSSPMTGAAAQGVLLNAARLPLSYAPWPVMLPACCVLNVFIDVNKDLWLALATEGNSAHVRHDPRLLCWLQGWRCRARR